ncbi:MAG TPA: methyltransferase domain-containing protein, partial [Ktedonobacteraceae bacterium]|nr:methyltransferase domain-containing protein [Ktedonobacteraceae bacterium]
CFGWFFRRRRKADGELTAWKGTTTSRGADYHVQDLQDKRRYLAESDYFLPKDREEEFRLNFQHHALFHAIGNHYVAPIDASMRMILDVGTGTGIWPIEMARLFPQAQVIGVDVDTALFKPETPDNCFLRVGNVLTGLPFPDQLFSYTHQRLLVAAITAENWPRVVRELVRVTRSGGWVELVEIDNQMQPAGPASIRLQNLAASVSASMGFDGEAIRHLGDLLKQAGLQTVETQQIVIPVGEWGGRVGSMLKRDFLTVMHTLQSLYCTRGALSPTEYERMVQEAASEWESLQACCTFFAVSGRRGLA